MVELPEGKMKSREGTVVDADDLIADMIETAREMSTELGKLDGCTKEEADDVCRIVGLGALKYFILKVDPKKTMLFDPRESIDFNGNTGPFIQYTHARICSILRKADEAGIDYKSYDCTELLPEEVALIKSMADFPQCGQGCRREFLTIAHRRLCVRSGQDIQRILSRPLDPARGGRAETPHASDAGRRGGTNHPPRNGPSGHRGAAANVTCNVSK